MEIKIKNTVPFIISEKMKYWGVSLTKHVSDSYAETVKHCSWIRTLHRVDMSVISKFMCRFNTTPIKISACFLKTWTRQL